MIRHMPKIIYSIICSVIIIMGLGYTTYLRFEGTYFHVPLQFNPDTDPLQLKVDKAVYKPGDPVEIIMSFCKFEEIQGVIQWNLVDNYLTVYKPEVVGLHPGCHTELHAIVGMIPLTAVVDTYHFEGTLMYTMNSLHTVQYPLRTQDFKVVR